MCRIQKSNLLSKSCFVVVHNDTPIGTAVAISKRSLLTSSRIVHGLKVKNFMIATEITKYANNEPAFPKVKVPVGLTFLHNKLEWAILTISDEESELSYVSVISSDERLKLFGGYPVSNFDRLKGARVCGILEMPFERIVMKSNNYLYLSSLYHPGMSGAPFFNRKGELVAIHVESPSDVGGVLGKRKAEKISLGHTIHPFSLAYDISSSHEFISWLATQEIITRIEKSDSIDGTLNENLLG
jgi:hypothetical protein